MAGKVSSAVYHLTLQLRGFRSIECSLTFVTMLRPLLSFGASFETLILSCLGAEEQLPKIVGEGVVKKKIALVDSHTAPASCPYFPRLPLLVSPSGFQLIRMKRGSMIRRGSILGRCRVGERWRIGPKGMVL